MNGIPQDGPERLRYAAQVMLAAADGEKIEYDTKGKTNFSWIPKPVFNWDALDYRVAPKPPRQATGRVVDFAAPALEAPKAEPTPQQETDDETGEISLTHRAREQREYESAYRQWFDTLSPSKRETLRRQGFAKPDGDIQQINGKNRSVEDLDLAEAVNAQISATASEFVLRVLFDLQPTEHPRAHIIALISALGGFNEPDFALEPETPFPQHASADEQLHWLLEAARMGEAELFEILHSAQMVPKTARTIADLDAKKAADVVKSWEAVLDSRKGAE